MRIVLENFPQNTTRYFSSPFGKEMLCLRKLFWIDNASLASIKRETSVFILKGTTAHVQLKQRVTPPSNPPAKAPETSKQSNHNTYIKANILNGPPSFTNSSESNQVSNIGTIPIIPWLSCDPIESPVKVHFIFYPEFYTGHNVPQEIRRVDGLLNQKPEKGVIIVQNYGFFFFDGIDELHLMCAFPKARNFLDHGKG